VKHGYDGRKPSISNEALITKFGVPPVEVVLEGMRLRFYSKLVVNASEALRTVLSALVEVPSSFSCELAANFKRLAKFNKLVEMPPFASDPHKWADLCSRSGHEFRCIVDLWVKSFCGGAGLVEIPLSEVPGLLPAVVRSDPFLPFQCEECGLAFASVQALGLHRRRVHNYMHPIRRMVWGSLCPVCGIQFHTRPRLIQHLAYDSTSCKAVFLDGEPLELSVDFIRTLDAADAVKARTNRRAGLPERFAEVPAG
jgi:hypothetical protein